MNSKLNPVLSFVPVALSLVMLAAFLGWVAGAPVQAAQAASFTVSKTEDTADGTCDADCSLREAIIAANATSEGDTVYLGAGTFELALVGSDNTALAGDLDITKPITITGLGPDQTIIDANDIDRVFEMRLNAGAVVLANLTVTGGNSANYCGGVFSTTGVNLRLENVSVYDNQAATVGGGMCASSGSATIQDSQIISNTAGENGGGIYVGSAQLTLLDSSILSNTAGWDGGGIYVSLEEALVTYTGPGEIAYNNACDGGGIYLYEGDADLQDVDLFSNDTADCGHGGAVHADQTDARFSLVNGSIHSNHGDDGGGIYIHNGAAALEQVAVINNQADNIGGGIYNGYGELWLTNVTVSGNSALVNSSMGGGGGGLFLGGSSIYSSKAELLFTTIAGNTSGTGFGGNPGGGGIQFANGDLNLQNTIIANNSNAVGTSNCSGANVGISLVTSYGNNLENTDTCGLTETSDLVNTDPLLSPLTIEGAHPLQANSPAIDSGICLPGIDVDQLGAARPQGDGCDIGAFEAAELPPVGLASVSIAGPVVGEVGVTYTFTADVTPVDATQPITYTWSPAPDSGQGTASVTYRWDAPGTQEISVSAQNEVNSAASAPFTITIEENVTPPTYTISLPLVVR